MRKAPSGTQHHRGRIGALENWMCNVHVRFRHWYNDTRARDGKVIRNSGAAHRKVSFRGSDAGVSEKELIELSKKRITAESETVHEKRYPRNRVHEEAKRPYEAPLKK